MLAQLTLSQTLPVSKHLLVIAPKSKKIADDMPHAELLKVVLARRDMKVSELAKTPVAANAPDGSLIVWAMLDFDNGHVSNTDKKPSHARALPLGDTFALQVQVRKAVQLLLEEHPKDIAIAVTGDEMERQRAAEISLYVAWINGALLPVHKKKDDSKPLKNIELYGICQYLPPARGKVGMGEQDSITSTPSSTLPLQRGGKGEIDDFFDAIRARAEGNLLCRSLTVTPPNELTPAIYRRRIAKLAAEHGWDCEEYDMKALRKMGAGAFVAVAQGSEIEDAAIVHLAYRHPKAKKSVALVGKGICFDTGGHNLKPSRYMHNMHEDMNGSAVALGVLLGASLQKLPVNIDCWLAIAQNHISAKAYKQNDIVVALNGTTIEIIHTDAEGRMVLADTLTLASREKPDLMIDFATLTGSMEEAVGNRYSGVLGNRDELLQRAVSVGRDTGERLCAFPMDEDYEAGLESKFADIKQCTLEGGADHILAMRFLNRFVEKDTPWLHVDLSAVRCEEGLGAVGTDVTGFGVGWGLEMVKG